MSTSLIFSRSEVCKYARCFFNNCSRHQARQILCRSSTAKWIRHTKHCGPNYFLPSAPSVPLQQYKTIASCWISLVNLGLVVSNSVTHSCSCQCKQHVCSRDRQGQSIILLQVFKNGVILMV